MEFVSKTIFMPSAERYPLAHQGHDLPVRPFVFRITGNPPDSLRRRNGTIFFD